jgi:hypothetical protein
MALAQRVAKEKPAHQAAADAGAFNLGLQGSPGLGRDQDDG